MSRPNASKRRKYARRKDHIERSKRKESVKHKGNARRMCTRKQRFRTQIDAMLKAMEIEGRRSVRLGTYKCPLCGGWHLTSHVNGR